MVVSTAASASVGLPATVSISYRIDGGGLGTNGELKVILVLNELVMRVKMMVVVVVVMTVMMVVVVVEDHGGDEHDVR